MQINAISVIQATKGEHEGAPAPSKQELPKGRGL